MPTNERRDFRPHSASFAAAVVRAIVAGCVLAGVPAGLFAEPCPGDAFREYTWRPDGKWQRVTWPEVTEPRARAFLPNAINEIRIDDLDQARKVEATIEMLLCHGGTAGKRIRVNGGPWIAIPESDLIPGDAGRGAPDLEYQSMRYPSVEIPLDQIRQGGNTFELTCSPGTALGKWWPQWLVYGVTFRVYYEPSKPHPAGRIVRPAAGDVLGESPVLEAEASGPEPIRQVDFIGLYEDFDWEGDGEYRQWHVRPLFGELHNHIGTASAAPFRVIWDNAWAPTQTGPVAVCARIVDQSGICWITPPVGDLRLVRSYSVEMCRPYDVPKAWSTRAGDTDACKVDVTGPLDKATAAKIVMVTWNGVAADEIGANGRKIVAKVGRNHDLSHDEFAVPVDRLMPGTNTLYTHSATEHHGIEVQWPGMVLFVRYAVPEK